MTSSTKLVVAFVAVHCGKFTLLNSHLTWNSVWLVPEIDVETCCRASKVLVAMNDQELWDSEIRRFWDSRHWNPEPLKLLNSVSRALFTFGAIKFPFYSDLLALVATTIQNRFSFRKSLALRWKMSQCYPCTARSIPFIISLSLRKTSKKWHVSRLLFSPKIWLQAPKTSFKIGSLTDH